MRLFALLSQGERVLRIAELCHKLEGEQKDVSSSLYPTEERRLETGPETEPAKVGSRAAVCPSVLQRPPGCVAGEKAESLTFLLRLLSSELQEIASAAQNPDLTQTHPVNTFCSFTVTIKTQSIKT